MKKLFSIKGILCLLILLTILLFVAIFALFQNIKNEDENASQTQNEINLSEKQNQYSVSLRESLQNSNSNIAKVSGSILSSDGDVAFIEQLENVAKENGVSITIDSLSVENIPNITSNNLTSFKIRAEAEGDWNGMMAFLTKLESLPYVARVEKLDLANSSDNPLSQTTPATSAQSWQSVFEIRVLQYK
jgi:Tfp pilus assembly protein PilO